MNETINILTTSPEIDDKEFATVDLEKIYNHVNNIGGNEKTIFGYLNNLEKLVDKQFFYGIDTSNGAFEELPEKLKKLEDIIQLLLQKLEDKNNLSRKDEYAEKLKNLKIKVDSYKGFYEQRTSKNLILNISKLSKVNTEKGEKLLVNYTEKEYKNYDNYKNILVTTYRFNSISQWLFYINENINNDINKIEKQKELVKYYDEYLEKEQNRSVKYGYAKKLFWVLIIESGLLFIIFLVLLFKLEIDDLIKLEEILKWVFGLTLGQILGMVLLIVKYLFKDSG